MREKAKIFFGVYCLSLFVPMVLGVLLVNLFVPKVRARRAVARRAARWFLKVSGIPFEVSGLQRLPKGPCVVVCNHASYLDGVVVAAALPPDFAFVIKNEMTRVPLANILLSRLGSEFVERFDRHKGGVDARRVLKRAADGQSIVFFPEGTFSDLRAVGKFHGGAFATAARNKLPIVAVAVSGTRDALPCGTLWVRRVPIHVQVLATFDSGGHETAPVAEIRQQARALIAAAVGERLLEGMSGGSD